MSIPGESAIDIIKCDAVAMNGPEFLAALAAALAAESNDVDALIMQMRSNQWAADQLELKHAHMLLRDAREMLANHGKTEST